MKGVLFVGWSKPYPGLERRSIKTFSEFLEQLTALEEQGEIERFESILLSPHGGDLDGFVLVFGEHEKLIALPLGEELHKLALRAQSEHERLLIVPGIADELVIQEIALVEELAEEYERELVPA